MVYNEGKREAERERERERERMPAIPDQLT
jgi:hypothetical protein